jgi:hypothetical protein
MVDTGAAFTMLTKGFCEAHGLTIVPCPGAYGQADRQTTGVISGVVNCRLQVADTLTLALANVKVIPDNSYHALMGCDLLTGDGKLLKAATIHCDS